MKSFIKKVLKKTGLYAPAVRVANWHYDMNSRCQQRMLKRKSDYEIDTIKAYCKKNSIDVDILCEIQDREIYIPTVFRGEKRSRVEKVKSPIIYKTVLSNVIVMGSNNTILIDKYCLNDKIELERSVNYDFAIGCCKSFSTEKRKAVFELDRIKPKIAKGINMFGEGSGNYYHWMIDILGRIAYINQFPELKDIPLLVDERALKHSTYLEALRFFDNLNHPIILLEQNKSYLVQELYYFSPCSFAGYMPVAKEKRVKVDSLLGYAKNEDVILHYQNHIADYTKNMKSPVGKRLFIDREGALNSRRLVNEIEAMDIACHYGFEKYNPSNYTLPEQVAAFRDADIVIGDEGAAFTNAIFGGKHTKFVLILPQKWNNCVFSTIAFLSGCQCEYLDAKETGNDRDHVIDLQYFEDYLKQLDEKE